MLAVSAMAAVQSPGPRAKTDRVCSCGGTSILIEVPDTATDCDTFNLVDATNDKMIVIGKPTTVPTGTLSAGSSSYCGNLGNSTADPCFATTADYYQGQMVAFLSGNNSRDMRVPNSVLMPSSAQNPGTKYSTISTLQHGSSGSVHNTCTMDGSDTRHWCKLCVS